MSAKFIDFLRNWGESLFTSKKAYIAKQPLPGSFHSSQTITTTSEYQDFISPVDGFASIDTRTSESGIRFRLINERDADTWIGQSFYKGTNATYSACVPVNKGDKVRLTYTKTGSQLLLNWIRSIGGGA